MSHSFPRACLKNKCCQIIPQLHFSLPPAVSLTPAASDRPASACMMKDAGMGGGILAEHVPLRNVQVNLAACKSRDLLDDCTSRQFQAPDPWVSRASWPAGSKSQPWNPKTTTQLNGPKMNGTAFRLAFRHELATRALVKLSRLPPGLRGSIDGGAETVDKTWTRNGRCRCMWISWVVLPG